MIRNRDSSSFRILLALLALALFALPAFSQDGILGDEDAHTEALNYISSALAAKERGDLQGAIKRFTYALDFEHLDDANRAIALNNRANCQADLGNWQDALMDYNQAVIIDPGFTEVYFNRAGLYYELGKYKEALSDYQQAANLSPQMPQPLFNMSFAWAKLGDYERAVATVEQALALDPANARYRQQLHEWQALR